jgi:general stress protein YciG
VTKKAILREMLSAIGAKGGRASARSLTAKQRTERARRAGLARQAKARSAKRGGANEIR